jgi:hypothetical protein
MNKIIKSLTSDISYLLDRPVFTPSEAEIVEQLLKEKMNKIIDKSLIIYRNENQNLINLINFEEEGGNYHNLMNGF